MHTRLPRRLLHHKFGAWRLIAHAEMLHKVAAATLAENVGVVCRRANGHGFGRDSIVIAEIMRYFFQLAFTQPDLVVDDNIVGRPGLGYV